MLEASKDKPTVVMIVVSLEDNSESETRYISGKTVGEVVSELFGEKEVKAKKPRAKRRTKAEMQTKEPDAAAGGEVPAEGPAPEPEARPRSRKIFA